LSNQLNKMRFLHQKSESSVVFDDYELKFEFDAFKKQHQSYSHRPQPVLRDDPDQCR